MTDPRLPRQRLLAAVEAAAANGIDWVQVRDHTASARELYDLARAVLAVARPRGVRVAVNDRIDVALAVTADGVQLGRRSLPLPVVRAIAPELSIGASVHNVTEASAAERAGAAWLTFGHVFPTTSHPNEPAPGLSELERIVRATRLPVVAIGGIAPDRIASVLEAGAAGVAVISAILDAPDPARATAELRRRLAATGRDDGRAARRGEAADPADPRSDEGAISG